MTLSCNSGCSGCGEFRSHMRPDYRKHDPHTEGRSRLLTIRPMPLSPSSRVASMDRMDAFRLAVAELGDAPAQKLSSFIERRFGIKIEPKFIPIFRASLLDLENLRRSKRIATP